MKIKIIIFSLVLILLIFLAYILSQNQAVSNSFISMTSPPQTEKNTANNSNNLNSENSPIQIIAEGLDTPWGLAILPDKSILVTERPGRIRLIDSQGNLQSQSVAVISSAKEIGEGGVLGITLHPDFAKNNLVYVYYTYDQDRNNNKNRVVKMTYQDKKLVNEQIVLDNIPGASNHDGGRIKFGPDKNLYITTGDAQDPSQAQNTQTLGGKILRVTDEGKAVAGNPFNNQVYSYGHRNPQGIAWDSNGQLWETEHGRSAPTGFDEVNLIESGKNYGWPTIEGDQTRPGMVTPKENSGSDNTWAPSGAAFFKNSLFFGGLRSQALYEVIIENNQVIEVKEHLKNQYGRIRDVVLGPDNMLYITTSNQDGRGRPVSSDDRIIRIDPSKL